jgi:pimeloyl-ACP methyl ester carboxylesterase
MRRFEEKKLVGLAVALALVLIVSPTLPGRQDSSRHQVRFVTVEPGVKLELLDWGGSGRAVVLLAGSGNTGHVFDDFATKLLDCCHVYAITRRGYGESSRPGDGYGWQRLAEDVFQVIDREHLANPVLIGHSMAGGEMTAVGHEHSDRLGGIVYLDALGDVEDDPPADKEWVAAQANLPPGLPPPPPKCDPEDRRSFAAYRRSQACSLGFMFPESELRNVFDEENDGSVGPPQSPGWVSHAIGQGQIFRRDYTNIRVPVLALSNGFAPTATTDDVIAVFNYKPADAAARAAIDRFMAESAIVFGRWTDKLKRGQPDARIVYYPNAGHFVYMTRETEVLEEIHAFVARLPATK